MISMACKCCTKHIPKPVSLSEVNGVSLCPTSACNLDMLLVAWDDYKGEPPGYVLKHYSAYVRGLAKSLHL